MRLRMAPASIIPDHLLFKIAYVQPKSSTALLGIGARLTVDGAGKVTALIGAWSEQHGGFDQKTLQSATDKQHGLQADGLLVLPAGLKKYSAWKLAVPPKGKSSTWQRSIERFNRGQALKQCNRISYGWCWSERMGHSVHVSDCSSTFAGD